MNTWFAISLEQLIVFIGLAYIVLFGLLSKTRSEALSLQFAVEGLIITAIGWILVRRGALVNPILFFFVLYTVTMRARWLADLGNFLIARRRYRDGMLVFDLALHLWPDLISRRIVEINQAVAFLRLGRLERARTMLERVLQLAEESGLSPKHVAAAHYNLGIIARVEGDEERARRHFIQATEVGPHTIYGYGARQALQGKPLATRKAGKEKENGDSEPPVFPFS